jgi:hypothetical protein
MQKRHAEQQPGEDGGQHSSWQDIAHLHQRTKKFMQSGSILQLLGFGESGICFGCAAKRLKGNAFV